MVQEIDDAWRLVATEQALIERLQLRPDTGQAGQGGKQRVETIWPHRQGPAGTSGTSDSRCSPALASAAICAGDPSTARRHPGRWRRRPFDAKDREREIGGGMS